MLRCSSFMQVKYNWERMGTIVLTIKKNNCKTIARTSLKVYSSKFFFSESIYKSIAETPNQ